MYSTTYIHTANLYMCSKRNLFIFNSEKPLALHQGCCCSGAGSNECPILLHKLPFQPPSKRGFPCCIIYNAWKPWTSRKIWKNMYNAERKLSFLESSLLLIFIYRVPTHYKLAAEPTECLRVIDFYEVLLIY